jgi:hypothetical protein
MVGCNADCHLKAPSWRRKEANKKRRMARKVGRWTMDQRPRSLDLGHDAVFDFLGRFSCSPVPSMLGFIFLIHSSLLWSMYGVMDVEAVVDYLSTSSVFTPVVAVFFIFSGNTTENLFFLKVGGTTVYQLSIIVSWPVSLFQYTREVVVISIYYWNEPPECIPLT